MRMRIKKNLRTIMMAAAAVAAVLIVALYYSYAFGGADEKSYYLIYIPKVLDEDNDFWSTLLEGAQMAAEEHHATLEILAPDSETDYEQQRQYIEEAIAKKPDAILVSPSSYTENIETLEKVKENGIRLVFIDSVVSEEVQDLTVATDNVNMGEQLGAYVCQFLDENSQIAIVAHVEGSSTAIEREEGIRAGLGEYESRIVETVFSGSEYSVAYEQTCALIEKYPDLTRIIGTNEYSAVGAARAIRDLGLQDQITFVGIDSSLEMIQLMEEGIFQGFIIQKSFNMGYLGVENTIALLNGSVKEGTNLDSGSKLITREELYTEENQKLLFPF
ncbi:MAG: substrate-binding domain-containing protein [Lachnospiraceae bacterium]|nr:substrate-binding domain-containing protein [Lachnospiraceae bacterium]